MDDTIYPGKVQGVLRFLYVFYFYPLPNLDIATKKGLEAVPFANFYAFAALTIAVNLSVLRDAPPIRPPSTLTFARSSAALASFIEPPY